MTQTYRQIQFIKTYLVQAHAYFCLDIPLWQCVGSHYVEKLKLTL